jgi:putative cardiolipin synthase
MGKMLYPLFVLFILACNSLPKNPERRPSSALPPARENRLTKVLQNKIGPPRGDNSAFTPLITGQEALLARLASANLADHTLDIQYYIWANDLTGLLVMNFVLGAADRGVRVRILLDDLNQGKYEKPLAILDTHPNIEVRMANPFSNRKAQWLDAFRFSAVNKRMHNKVMIADNLLGIVGGRNIGNEYFWASQEMNFGDFDLWAAGPVVRDLSKEFDAYWNSDIAYPIASLMPDYRPLPKDLADLRTQAKQAVLEAQKTEYEQTLLETVKNEIFLASTEPVFWSKAEVVFDPPEKFNQSEAEQNATLKFQLKPYVDETEKEMLLISPYFIPDQNGLIFFKDLNKRGVKTTVLTNSLASSDVYVVFSGYKGTRKDLLRNGVSLYELKPRASETLKRGKHIGSSSSQSGLHGKVFIFDRKNIFVGSMNLDPRSMILNSEMGVIVHSPELASFVATRMLANLPETAFKVTLTDKGDLQWEAREKGQTYYFNKEPETSWWKRFKANMMSLVVPSSQL